MKLWIIGKRGLLATAFQRVCKEKQVPFVATSRKEVDITKAREVESQFQTLSFTHVVNCSGYANMDEAEQNEQNAYLLNALAAENLGVFAAKYKKKIIHFSTSYVFDGDQESPYSETALSRPISIYGKTKEEGEKRLLFACPHACIIRTSWLFDTQGSNLLTNLQKQIESQESISLFSDQIGRPTFCEDLVEMSLRLLDAEGIFHFANQGITSLYDFGQTLFTLLKNKFPIRCRTVLPITYHHHKQLAKRPRFSVLDTDKCERRMAIKPRHWKEILQEKCQ